MNSTGQSDHRQPNENQRFPEKIVRQFIEGACVTGLGIIFALFLFPFYPTSFALNCGASLPAIFLYARSRCRADPAKRRYYRVAALFSVIGAVTFAVFSPFLAAPKPLYISVLPSLNPFGSSFSIIGNGKRMFGSFMTVSDPLRRLVSPKLEQAFPEKIRGIEQIHITSKKYAVLPYVSKYLLEEHQNGPVESSGSFYLPLNVRRTWISMAATNNPPNILYSSGSSYVLESTSPSRKLPVDFDYYAVPETVPWNAVFWTMRRITERCFTRRIWDRALDFLVNDKLPECLAVLDQTKSVQPRSNLEGARIMTLDCPRYILPLGRIGRPTASDTRVASRQRGVCAKYK